MNYLVIQCSDIAFLLRIFKYIIKLVRIAVPIILIVTITFDLVKAMTGKSDDEMKKVWGKISTRLIWAVAIFFVPLFIEFIFSRIGVGSVDGLSGPMDWIKCYKSIK